MRTFLTGLGGVAVGALLVLALDRGEPAASRAPTPRIDGLERAIVRLEEAVSRLPRAAPEHEDVADPPGSPARTDGNDGAAGDPAARVTTPDRGTARPMRPEEILALEERPGLLAERVPLGTGEATRRFMLWTLDRVVRTFGRPRTTTIVEGHPALQYEFPERSGRTHIVRFVLADGIVYRVYVH